MRATISCIGLAGVSAGAPIGAPWMDTSLPPEERARLVIGNMTRSQKLRMLHGKFTGNPILSEGYVGFVDGVPELGIPDITMNDGPQGFRAPGNPGTSTCFPSGMTIGATWDPELARLWGEAMGEEFAAKGSNVQLGPGLNVARVPRNGRNFEYISGEDPHLGAVMAPPVIQGIQSKGVVANAKHWVNNNQETHRGTLGPPVDEVVDERTQWEIYYPPFEAAVKADVGSFMCGYNKVNGKNACGSDEILKTDLKERMGFKGWVMSDWLATHGIALSEGLDQEMPWSMHYNEPNLEKALLTGKATMAQVEDSVSRMLTPLIKVGAFDNHLPHTPTVNVTSPKNTALARRLAAEATVLLKNNDGILPLTASSKFALLGTLAKVPVIGGGGSGFVNPAHVSNPYDALGARLGADVAYGDESDLEAAAQVAAAADVAIVFVGASSSEGTDRADLSLPAEHDQLIQAVASAQKNVVVVVATPGPVLTPWRDDVAAILVPFMPGQEFGEAIADVLLGDVNPAARLHHTMPNIENEVQMTKSQFPGTGGLPGGSGLTSTYTEKLEVGYRWYSSHGVVPAFAFGHGLSYTSFTYGGLRIDDSSVAFNVTNAGARAGAEVAQMYLTFPASAGEPPKQLRGFAKVPLQPGESKEVQLPISARAFSIWDVGVHDWQEVSGEFSVAVGASSMDIRATGSIQRGGVSTLV